MVLQINRAKKDYWLKHWAALLMAAAFMALVFSGLSQAETLEQRTFASPEEAVKALVGALKSNDVNALEAIFGPGSEDLVSSGDPVWDSVEYERTIKRYEEKNWLEETDGNVVLYIGKEDWPFAIPIVKKDVLWHFDTEQGREEILARRIGKNELSTIQACLAYVDAQREYALKDRDNNAFLEYARQFISDPGKKNGLYWDVKEGEQRSPLGPLFAEADEEGYTLKSGEKPSPYHGYYYRILTAQGENVPGGAYDYMVKGKMIGGFALVAYPATYESSGIMTFLVNHDGVVYQKDLGPDTEEAARTMTVYNPDSTWTKVAENDLMVEE
jgi:hypothetical protein